MGFLLLPQWGRRRIKWAPLLPEGTFLVLACIGPENAHGAGSDMPEFYQPGMITEETYNQDG